MLNWSIHARYERKDWAMKLDAIGIVCENLKQSIAFYRMLGLPFGELEGDHIEFPLMATSKSPTCGRVKIPHLGQQLKIL
jgi:hypothetical protein